MFLTWPCSAPNDGMSKIHLFYYKLKDTKQENYVFSTAGLSGLSHTPDTNVMVGKQAEFLREIVETVDSKKKLLTTNEHCLSSQL